MATKQNSSAPARRSPSSKAQQAAADPLHVLNAAPDVPTPSLTDEQRGVLKQQLATSVHDMTLWHDKSLFNAHGNFSYDRKKSIELLRSLWNEPMSDELAELIIDIADLSSQEGQRYGEFSAFEDMRHFIDKEQ